MEYTTQAVAAGYRSDEETAAEPGLWQRLVAGILKGDDSAEQEFGDLYGRGAGVLVRRQLGRVGTDHLVNEIIAGAIREIRRGLIREPRDMVQFLRNVTERESMARAVGPQTAAPVPAHSGHENIRAQATVIAQVLGTFPPRERAALEAYYGGNRSARDSAAENGLSIPEFSASRRRLRSEVERLSLLRKPAAAETAAGLPRERAMAASR